MLESIGVLRLSATRLSEQLRLMHRGIDSLCFSAISPAPTKVSLQKDVDEF